MFDFIEDAFDNVLDVADDLLSFEVDTDKVIKLAQDGMSVYAIADLTGTSVDVIKDIIND